MASNDYVVYVPDRSAPFRFPRTMAPEEVRASLVATGHTAIETSELVLSADGGTITFRRATGGTKGL